MNLNKIFILGRLTADPQLRTTPNGQSVSTFSVATNRIWTDKQGQRQQDVQFHNIVVWQRQAEIASQFLRKGSLVLIEGRVQTRKWQDQQGQNRQTTEIICEKLQLGPRAANSGNSSNQSGANQSSASTGVDKPEKEKLPEIEVGDNEIKADDIPF